MTELLAQVVRSLLEKIIVFEVSFKKEILEKSVNLDIDGSRQLKEILLEVIEWQTNFLKKKISEDADFYLKVMDARRQADIKIIEAYKQKFGAEDHEKIEDILYRIESL